MKKKKEILKVIFTNLVYFKTNHITNYLSEDIENALRKYSLRRHTSLDFNVFSTYITEKNKFFLGYENNEKIEFLRISTPIEKLLPKIIITFKKNNFTEYRLKLNFVSLAICTILTLALILNILYSIDSQTIESDLLLILILNSIFYTLFYLEYTFTNNKLKKVITLYSSKTK